MGKIEDAQAKYDAVRRDLQTVGADEWVMMEMEDWASGPIAAQHFGSTATPLDALCLIAAREKAMPLALYHQVNSARAEQHSWAEIATALGVSRQAAVKRFKDNWNA